MRAAVYPGGGAAMVIETLPDPEPGPGELLIRVHRCGICGTDLHMTEGHKWQFTAGSVPGHEYSGEIIAIGKCVESFRLGENITAIPSLGCGQCIGSKSGNNVLCQHRGGVLGGFAELMTVPAEVAIKLPSTLSLADGALIEPLAVGRYGVRLVGVRPGEPVLVLGAGSAALCAIYWLRRMGAGRIAVLARSERRRDLALALGADAFLTDPAGIADALGGSPAQVFECVGSPGFVAQAIGHCRTLGQVISLGFCTAPDALVPAMAGYKGVSLHFPVGYAMDDFRATADIMDKGHVDPKCLISSVRPLDALPATFAELRGANAETKVHIAPTMV
jgi:threonine dehydrogenase-like Zn-dependent dehydrogenase